MVEEDFTQKLEGQVLERNSPVAVYQQVADVLADHVSRLEPGARIPTEESLMEEYGISRTTVRKAMETLVAKGLLVRRQGKEHSSWRSALPACSTGWPLSWRPSRLPG